MSRAAFLMDRVMAKSGLEGSARLPVFTLLVGLLVAPQTHWLGLSAQGVTMFLARLV
jgi:Fe2+ transport system protein B